MRASVGLPAPAGADRTNISPRRSTPSKATAVIASLQILDLLAELLDHVFHLEPGLRQFQVVRFAAAVIDLAVEFLGKEIEAPADRTALFDHLAGLRDVRGDA